MVFESPLPMESLEVSDQKFHDPCSFDSLYTSAKFFCFGQNFDANFDMFSKQR